MLVEPRVVGSVLVALVLTLASAGCGDNPTYQLRIESAAGDVIVIASGTAQDPGSDSLIREPAFIVKAGANALTPRINADIGSDGRWLAAVVVVLAEDCSELGSMDLGLGPSTLRIDGDNQITVEPVTDAEVDLDRPSVAPVHSPCR